MARMISALRPVHAEWLHTFVVQPFMEGAQRVNRAWRGFNVHSLNRTLLSLKERIVSFAIGLILLLPLISTIVWIVWQTFGRPEKLSDPYCPEGKETLSQVVVQAPASPLSALSAAAAISTPAGTIADHFAFHEISTTKGLLQTNWNIQTLPEMFLVQQYCDAHSSTSMYDTNWAAKEFHRQEGGENLEIWRREPDYLDIRFTPRGGNGITKRLPIDPLDRWIQQPTVGFRKFIKGGDATWRFQGVASRKFRGLPLLVTPPFLIPFIATKQGLETVSGYTNKLFRKVEIISQWPWPYNSVVGQLWFDPDNGDLIKFIDPVEGATIERIQAHPSPAPAHP
jgi:hypothetical protein